MRVSFFRYLLSVLPIPWNIRYYESDRRISTPKGRVKGIQADETVEEASQRGAMVRVGLASSLDYTSKIIVELLQ